MSSSHTCRADECGSHSRIHTCLVLPEVINAAGILTSVATPNSEATYQQSSREVHDAVSSREIRQVFPARQRHNSCRVVIRIEKVIVVIRLFRKQKDAMIARDLFSESGRKIRIRLRVGNHVLI
jgi:hypothetical protein